MPGREVERVEVVPRRLDLAAVDDRVAEPEEDVLDLAPDLGDEVELTAPDRRSRACVTSTRSSVRRAVELRRARAPPAARRSRPRAARGARSAPSRSRGRAPRAARASARSCVRGTRRARARSRRPKRPRPLPRGRRSRVPRRPRERRGYQRPPSPSYKLPMRSLVSATARGRASAACNSTGVTLYDPIAGHLRPVEPRSVIEDVAFYVERGARGTSGPVVELGRRHRAGSRSRSPRRAARVIGVDSSDGHARGRARAAPSEQASPTSSTCGSATCASRPVDERVAARRSARSARCSTCGRATRSCARSRAARRPARRRRAVRLRRLRAEPRGHRGDARALARARAGDLRARGLGRGLAHALALRPRLTESRRRSDCTGSPRPSGCRCSTRRASTSRRSTAGSTGRPYDGGEDMVWRRRRRDQRPGRSARRASIAESGP